METKSKTAVVTPRVCHLQWLPYGPLKVFYEDAGADGLPGEAELQHRLCAPAQQHAAGARGQHGLEGVEFVRKAPQGCI